MEGRYPAGVWISLMDCTEIEKEAAFNRWCDETLVPGIESLGFVRNSRRYENALSDSPTFQGRPKYLVLSEVYHEDLNQALMEIRARDSEIKGALKRFEAYVTKLNTLYGRIGPEFRTERTGRTVQAIYCGFLGCADPAREGEFNRWYNERHSPETIHNNIFEFDTGYRYSVIDPCDPIPHQSAPYLSLYETSLPPSQALQGLSGLRKNSVAVRDTIWIELLTVFHTGLFRPLVR
jgi:hypothetical protein